VRVTFSDMMPQFATLSQQNAQCSTLDILCYNIALNIPTPFNLQWIVIRDHM